MKRLAKDLPAINADTLFHFTPTFSVLKKILSSGIRFSYSVENPLDSTNPGVAIPMVSFCDIPLSKTSRHARKYGSYCIGFDKDFLLYLCNPILNPIIYLESDNLIKSFSDLFSLQEKSYCQFLNNLFSFKTESQYQENAECMSNEELKDSMKKILCEKGLYENTTYDFSKKFILGLLKPTYSKKGYCFFDEREWRALYFNDLENAPWIWECDSLSKEYKEKLNGNIAATDKGFITIPNDWFHMINYIIVKNDSQIFPLIHYIMKAKRLFGNSNATTEQRLVLISRIFSFERLNADI